jgi:hypothetical protein
MKSHETTMFLGTAPVAIAFPPAQRHVQKTSPGQCWLQDLRSELSWTKSR